MDALYHIAPDDFAEPWQSLQPWQTVKTRRRRRRPMLVGDSNGGLNRQLATSPSLDTTALGDSEPPQLVANEESEAKETDDDKPVRVLTASRRARRDRKNARAKERRETKRLLAQPSEEEQEAEAVKRSEPVPEQKAKLAQQSGPEEKAGLAQRSESRVERHTLLPLIVGLDEQNLALQGKWMEQEMTHSDQHKDGNKGEITASDSFLVDISKVQLAYAPLQGSSSETDPSDEFYLLVERFIHLIVQVVGKILRAFRFASNEMEEEHAGIRVIPLNSMMNHNSGSETKGEAEDTVALEAQRKEKNSRARQRKKKRSAEEWEKKQKAERARQELREKRRIEQEALQKLKDETFG
ncbi:hypothetical protein F4677DRAFT_425019 [Hypoxylon crocopeplum]|nr:hypothetical protein F4677DRAFT_425019 [Hypoxylon crocopeplum]